ncbi:hypothetical protein HPX47_004817 [Vibrio alginolyticus]|nr:hypothetical protein [Vibrio alginolyticus]
MKIETIEQLTALLKESALVPNNFDVDNLEKHVNGIADPKMALAVYASIAGEAIFKDAQNINFLEERDRGTVSAWMESGSIEGSYALNLIFRAAANKKKYGDEEYSVENEPEPTIRDYCARFEQSRAAPRTPSNDPIGDYCSIFTQDQKPNHKQ